MHAFVFLLHHFSPELQAINHSHLRPFIQVVLNTVLSLENSSCTPEPYELAINFHSDYEINHSSILHITENPGGLILKLLSLFIHKNPLQLHSICHTRWNTLITSNYFNSLLKTILSKFLCVLSVT